MDFTKKAYEYSDLMLKDLNDLISIRSVKDLNTAGDGKPMGKEISYALEDILSNCRREGFRTANLDGYAGYAEYGPKEAEDYIAVLCHVDVVPAGEGWTYPPFCLTAEDGKLIGRGTLDDKGPAIAVLYALKMIKENNLKLKHRVRLIFGTDEENGCECIAKYKSLEKMPLCGFSPDADFPIVNAEKGQINVRIILVPDLRKNEDGLYHLERFFAGGIPNMAADRAEAVISGGSRRLEQLNHKFLVYCETNKIKNQVIQEESRIILKVTGKTAHGMEPEKGVHAGLLLAHFMSDISFDRLDACNFISCVDTYLYNDYTGKTFGVEMQNAEMGSLTINSGIQQYLPDGESYFHINLRYPSCGSYEEIIGNISEKAAGKGFQIESSRMTVKMPHLVTENHPMIGILKNAYTAVTGKKPYLLSTGGGTYAAHISNGVSYGPLFPDREETAHRADEAVYLEDLIQSVSIYAKAIYGLGNI